MHELGVNHVVITDGPNGAYASDGQQMLFMPIYPDPKPPYDRTGAGDAFASTRTAALSLGETLETALAWAPINSMNVSQYIGAQEGLVTKEKLNEFLQSAPEEYKAKAV
jgi:ribokinase